MHQQRLIRRSMRRIWHWLPLSKRNHWHYLRYYPTVEPTDTLLQRWNTSPWEEYQRWLNCQPLQNASAWRALHRKAQQWFNPPKISIVTPVHNTAANVLYECILSVRMQTYPYWQWILVDDGSTCVETLQLLRSGVCKDPRIKIIFMPVSHGISRTTNKALSSALGDYVVFLDHDDRLSLDALHALASAIQTDPTIDILYSDRDMLSEHNQRYLHLFKPDWSPETLLSGNYIFHLMCYRRSLLNWLQGLRPDYDGSQDYDLILRASELHPNVQHIPQILYHWRQHSASVSLNIDAKQYAFKAGLTALNAALRRRGIKGYAQEIPNFRRGTYQLVLQLPHTSNLQIITLPEKLALTEYAKFVAKRIDEGCQPYIAIISSAMTSTDDTLLRLAAWLQFAQVGLVSGKIISLDNCLEYVGMAYNQDTSLIHPYRGFALTEPGYMGIVQITRNISAPHPMCVVLRREIWQQLQGFVSELQGPHALLDFALRALQNKWRTVIVPQCVFNHRGLPFRVELESADAKLFKQYWQTWLGKGDPYYNLNLAQNSPDMGLAI